MSLNFLVRRCIMQCIGKITRNLLVGLDSFSLSSNTVHRKQEHLNDNRTKSRNILVLLSVLRLAFMTELLKLIKTNRAAKMALHFRDVKI